VSRRFTPERPAQQERQKASRVQPIGETTPIPVIKTRDDTQTPA